MENNAIFHYQYSAAENAEVQEIRKKYLPQPVNALEELKRLDAKVGRPANVFAYLFGSISALIMGSGMSLVMTELGATLGLAEPMIPGIAIGIVGLIMAAINYPIYKGILSRHKKKYAGRILELSEKIMNK